MLPIPLEKQLELEDRELELDDGEQDIDDELNTAPSLLESRSVSKSSIPYVAPHSHVDKAADLYMAKLDNDLMRMTEQLDTKLENLQHDAEFHI